MTARVYNCLEVERRRCQRARKRAAQEGGSVDHFAHLQGQFQASRDLDDSARVYCAEEGHVGGYLSQIAASSLQTAGAYMSAYAAATAWAGSLMNLTAQTLHRAASLVARPSLQRGVVQCRSGNREPNANGITEKFSQ
jgi:hypothetical protein